jgi:26S proteasome regulatory subunit N2
MESGDQHYVGLVATALPDPPLSPQQSSLKLRLDKLKRILVGGFSSELALAFLHKYSDSDRLFMDNFKKSLEDRGGHRISYYHNCAIIAHSYLNAGTTNDSFLRDNLEWMKKTYNWFVVLLSYLNILTCFLLTMC